MRPKPNPLVAVCKNISSKIAIKSSLFLNFTRHLYVSTFEPTMDLNIDFIQVFFLNFYNAMTEN